MGVVGRTKVDARQHVLAIAVDADQPALPRQVDGAQAAPAISAAAVARKQNWGLSAPGGQVA
jgi:hypothetical protein